MIAALTALILAVAFAAFARPAESSESRSGDKISRYLPDGFWVEDDK